MRREFNDCGHDKIFLSTTRHGQQAKDSKGRDTKINLRGKDGKIQKCFLCRIGKKNEY